MATMPDADRREVNESLMRDFSADREVLGALAKSELRAAVNAADQWASDNAASYNSALPLPARTALTAAQKARLLTAVIRKRWLSGV